ncbi:DUF935 domain-containing protein [Treponema vincentii]|uniref:DUF935 domain-containing protein n=1 Tax=Treponema vincentii TaxID=69710 RepID=UPI0020A47669|nr:DUF935 domain-containing protein [Treponema vincentii]
MLIDIIESKTTANNAAVYQDIAEWVDKLSKLVLGQTASRRNAGDSKTSRRSGRIS